MDIAPTQSSDRSVFSTGLNLAALLLCYTEITVPVLRGCGNAGKASWPFASMAWTCSCGAFNQPGVNPAQAIASLETYFSHHT